MRVREAPGVTPEGFTFYEGGDSCHINYLGFKYKVKMCPKYVGFIKLHETFCVFY